MNDDKLKALMQESLVKTSEGFTATLMREIERQQHRKKVRNYFIIGIFLCTVLCILLPRFTAQMRLWGFEIRMLRGVMRVGGPLVALLLLNQLIVFRNKLLGTSHS